MPAKNELHLTDIALLKCIIDHPNCTKRDLWRPRRQGEWNRFLYLSGLIRLGRCTYVTREPRFGEAIATLRFCGYLYSDVPHYLATDLAKNLFFTLSPRPALWPLLVPLAPDGGRMWESAIYFTAK